MAGVVDQKFIDVLKRKVARAEARRDKQLDELTKYSARQVRRIYQKFREAEAKAYAEFHPHVQEIP